MSLALVVENSRAMGEATCQALRGAGFEAAQCHTLAEAVSACQERRPDVVASEYYLPDGTAEDFLARLARLGRPCPVIVATGCGNEAVSARCLLAGAFRYVQKTENYLRELPGLAREALKEWEARAAAAEKDLQRRRLEAQNELAGWLAHNFKNILAASIGYINLVNLDDPDQDRGRQKEYLAESRQGQESAIHLLEQLIRMTASEGGEPERVIVGEVVDEAWATAQSRVLESFRRQYPERLAEIEAKVPRVALLNGVRRLPPVRIVREDLQSILEALLQNALEAVLVTAEARVKVGGEVEGHRLSLAVEDNGRGMSETVLRHATEPLFSTKGEVGVGLSLSLVSSLVMRHGGDLALESQAGAGAKATITCDVAGSAS